MSSNFFTWFKERLRSDALQHRVSPLHCLIPEGWEKEGDVMKMESMIKIRVCNLNFIISHPCGNPIFLIYSKDIEMASKSQNKRGRTTFSFI
jgi:hypothetical protein